MAGNKMIILLLAIVVSMATTASAAQHIVGGSTGWTIPSSSSLYSQWASSQKYAVGDTLLFNFTTGIHNVMEVPKGSYDSCSSTNQIGSTLTTGPATVTLTKPGNRYFICGVVGHCSIGQKLAINVVSSPSPVPAASAPKSAAPKRAPKSAAPASSPISSPATSPASSPTVGGPAPSLAAPASSVSPSSSQSPTTSPVADSPTTNVAPSANKGGSLGPTSSDNQNPTAAAGPSDGAISSPVSMLSGGYLGSFWLLLFFLLLSCGRRDGFDFLS